MFPLKYDSASVFKSSRGISPYRPFLMWYASTPSHSPFVGACAKMHGHGMVQLQTSNQSPEAVQLGTSEAMFLDTLDGILSWGQVGAVNSSITTYSKNRPNSG